MGGTFSKQSKPSKSVNADKKAYQPIPDPEIAVTVVTPVILKGKLTKLLTTIWNDVIAKQPALQNDIPFIAETIVTCLTKHDSQNEQGALLPSDELNKMLDEALQEPKTSWIKSTLKNSGLLAVAGLGGSLYFDSGSAGAATVFNNKLIQHVIGYLCAICGSIFSYNALNELWDKLGEIPQEKFKWALSPIAAIFSILPVWYACYINPNNNKLLVTVQTSANVCSGIVGSKYLLDSIENGAAFFANLSPQQKALAQAQHAICTWIETFSQQPQDQHSNFQVFFKYLVMPVLAVLGFGSNLGFLMSAYNAGSFGGISLSIFLLAMNAVPGFGFTSKGLNFLYHSGKDLIARTKSFERQLHPYILFLAATIIGTMSLSVGFTSQGLNQQAIKELAPGDKEKDQVNRTKVALLVLLLAKPN
jgi:hypothetical protein